MLNLIADNSPVKEIEAAYISVRKAEGRLYTNEEVIQLPYITRQHAQYTEWCIRQHSLKRILNYLKHNTNAKTILDVGCGNGWMCNRLQQAGYNVTGLDVNQTELKQAESLFPDVRFMYADIFENNNMEKFDVVLFSASIQYFKDAVKLIQHVKDNYLAPHGIVIIADTHFYSTREIAVAKKRTEEYYSSMHAPQMAQYYFHHASATFHHFRHRVVYKKTIFDIILSKLKNHPQPFQLFVIF